MSRQTLKIFSLADDRYLMRTEGYPRGHKNELVHLSYIIGKSKLIKSKKKMAYTSMDINKEVLSK